MKRRTALARALAAASLGVLAAGSAASLPAEGEEEFITGSGRAEAKIVRVGPAAGQLALAPTFGLSLADYLGTLGRGESRVFEWGALEDSVPEEFRAETPNLRVESTDEGSDAGKTAGQGAWEQRAAATKAPSGQSSFKLATFGIPGAVEASAATAESWAGIPKRGTREARGVTRVGTLSLGGGAVTLAGLTWEAVQRTGEGATVAGSFRIEGVSIGGQSVAVPSDPSQLGALFTQINTALAPTGLVLDPPAVATDNGVARVTPLGVRVVNSQVGQTVVAPVIGGLQPVREPVAGAIIDNCDDCKAAILVADVTVGVVSGGGRADLEIGGVMGTTEGIKYESPFKFDFGSGFGELGATDDFAPGFGDDTASLGGEVSGASFGGSGTGAAPASISTPGTSPASPGGAAGRTTTELAGSRRLPGKTGGVAVLIGLVGLLGALALGAADYRAITSARRTIPV